MLLGLYILELCIPLFCIQELYTPALYIPALYIPLLYKILLVNIQELYTQEPCKQDELLVQRIQPERSKQYACRTMICAANEEEHLRPKRQRAKPIQQPIKAFPMIIINIF